MQTEIGGKMKWRHPPKICQWDITNKCNLNCRHCRATCSWEKREEADFPTVISCLGQLFSLAPDIHLAIAGGEPLMRKDLKDILLWIKKNYNIRIGLLSNGTLIDGANIGWLKDSVDSFNISLEGSSREVNDFVRGRGSFQKALSGISFLTKYSLPVTVRMTFFNQEETEVEGLMRFLPDIGVRSFNFRQVVSVGNAGGTKKSKERHRIMSEKIWSIGKELGIEVGYSDPFPELLINEERKKIIDADKELKSGCAVTGCSMGFDLLYIDPEGVVKGCPYFPLVVDKIQTTPLSEIWFKNEILNKIRGIRSLLKGKCGKCEYKYACGGCRGAAWANGNFLGEDPRCWK